MTLQILFIVTLFAFRLAIARADLSCVSDLSKQYMATSIANMRKMGVPLKALSATVQINGNCSATWISDKGYLLTAAHCLDSCSRNTEFTGVSDIPTRIEHACSVQIPGMGKLKISFAVIGNCSKPGIVMDKCSKKNDLAILKVDLKNNKVPACLNIDTQAKSLNTKVAAIGFPRPTLWHQNLKKSQKLKHSQNSKHPQVASFGEIVNFDQCTLYDKKSSIAELKDINPLYKKWGAIQATANTARGGSGGPLVDLETGRIIAITSYGDLNNDETEVCSGSSFFEPLTKLQETIAGRMSESEDGEMKDCSSR